MHKLHTLCQAGLIAWALCGTAIVRAADLCVLASAKSTAGPMTLEQASQVFQGKSGPYSEGRKINLFDLAEGQAMRADFYTKVTGKDQAQLKAYWSRLVFTGKGLAPKEFPDVAALKKALAADPDAIGYADCAAADASVKVLLKLG
jgi:hypothetical protein